MFTELQSYLHSINSSKILSGIAMLILNVGSKYVQIEFSKTQESALKSALTREILIFVIVFTATRDLIISILMTAAFTILADHLFNDQSKYCIIPKKYWAMYSAADINKDGTVSPEEEAAAIEILNKATQQKQLQQHSIQNNSYLSKQKEAELNVHPHEVSDDDDGDADNDVFDTQNIFPKKDIFGPSQIF